MAMVDAPLHPAGHPTERLIGTSPAIAALRAQMRHLATFDAVGNPYVPTVLLQSEIGTGKGLVARVLHDSGPRASGPFIEVNCAAVPETMLEAELWLQGYSWPGNVRELSHVLERVTLLHLAEEVDGTTFDFLDSIRAQLPTISARLLACGSRGRRQTLNFTCSRAPQMGVGAARVGPQASLTTDEAPPCLVNNHQ